MEAPMTDLYDLKDLPVRTGDPDLDLLWELMRLAAKPGGIPHWAHVQVLASRQLRLSPLDRGPFEDDLAYSLGPRELHRGVCRIVLRPAGEVPLGVGLSTRDLLALALETRNLTGLQPVDADAAVQCGLFGEVLYP
jgi:hypothetical protein